MHAFLEADMGKKPALQPKAAIGPAVRAIAVHILARARAAMTDPELSSQDAVHEFRRAMKEWRALMRLLAPFIADAERWRIEARDHARSLAQARDSQAALNALDDLAQKGRGAVRALDRDGTRAHRGAARQRGARGADTGTARRHPRLAR